MKEKSIMHICHVAARKLALPARPGLLFLCRQKQKQKNDPQMKKTNILTVQNYPFLRNTPQGGGQKWLLKLITFDRSSEMTRIVLSYEKLFFQSGVAARRLIDPSTLLVALQLEPPTLKAVELIRRFEKQSSHLRGLFMQIARIKQKSDLSLLKYVPQQRLFSESSSHVLAQAAPGWCFGHYPFGIKWVVLRAKL